MMKQSLMDNLLDGVEVEWRALGDISEFYGGLTGKSKKDFINGNALYIPYRNIFNNIEVSFDKLESVRVSASENQHEVKYGDVLFTGSSETAEEAGMSSAVALEFENKVYLNSFSFGVRFNDDIHILPEFSKYLFRCHFMRTEIAKTASGVTRFNISKARFKKLKVPILSLRVQKEIVSVLDTFTKLATELITELTAELTARKKQYSYYRDKLFAFNEDEVDWKPLGDIGEIIRGTGLQKKDFINEGFPAIHYGQLHTKYGLYANETFTYIPESLSRRLKIANKNDLLIATTSENDEDLLKPVAWLGDKAAISGDMMLLRHNQNVKYLAFYFQTDAFQKQKRKYITGAKVRRVSKDNLGKLLVPIPKSISEQERIVSVLDKFDAATASIIENLSKEIELRQKQYEYYRNMLLSFPKEDVEA